MYLAKIGALVESSGVDVEKETLAIVFAVSNMLGRIFWGWYHFF